MKGPVKPGATHRPGNRDKKSLTGVRDTHQARLTLWQKDAKED